MIPPELLPDHPEPGQVVELPDGVTGGTIAVIVVMNDAKHVIGNAENIEHVANIAGHYNLSSVTLASPVHEGDNISVRAFTWDITAIEFVNFFGWQACRWDNPTKTLEEEYEVCATVPIPFVMHQKTEVTRYAALCLRKGANHDSTRTKKPTGDDETYAGDAPTESSAGRTAEADTAED